MIAHGDAQDCSSIDNQSAVKQLCAPQNGIHVSGCQRLNRARYYQGKPLDRAFLMLKGVTKAGTMCRCSLLNPFTQSLCRHSTCAHLQVCHRSTENSLGSLVSELEVMPGKGSHLMQDLHIGRVAARNCAPKQFTAFPVLFACYHFPFHPNHGCNLGGFVPRSSAAIQDCPPCLW